MVGDDDAVGTKAHGIFRVFWIEDAFDDHGPFPEVANPLQIGPRDRRVEVRTQIAHIVFQADVLAQKGGDVAQCVWAAHEAHVHGPVRVCHRLHIAAHGGVGATHAGMRIAVAGAGHGHVYREDQRRDTGCLCALQRVLHEAAVLEHIELKPHGPLDLGGHLFDGADRDGRQGKWNAFLICSHGGLHFAAAGVHTRQAHGRQRHRQRQLFTKQLDAGIELAHVLEHALAQCDIGQVADIAAQCFFRVGTAVDVVKQKWGQALLCGCAVVGGGRNNHENVNPVGTSRPWRLSLAASASAWVSL